MLGSLKHDVVQSSPHDGAVQSGKENNSIHYCPRECGLQGDVLQGSQSIKQYCVVICSTKG